MRIKAYFCTNPNKLHKESPAETYKSFAGDTPEECEDKAMEYAKARKWELTGWDEYIDDYNMCIGG